MLSSCFEWLLISALFLNVAAFSFFGQDEPVISEEKKDREKQPVEGVSGRVTAASGHPIAGARVHPQPVGDSSPAVPEMLIVTDEDGRYTWRLHPAEYEITVSAPGYRDSVKRVVVRAGEQAMLDFSLELQR